MKARSLHYKVVIPEEGISMEIDCGIKPKSVSLLSISSTIGIHIGLKQIWLSRNISQKLKV